MKRLIMTMVMAAVMSMTVSAQRIDNTIKEARILTDKMVEEVNLNNWQREKAKKEVLGEGLPIYDCINFACIFFLPYTAVPFRNHRT